MAPKLKSTTAVCFAHTRKAHATERAEDYVEAIADLAEEKGEARVVELAKRLGVTHVTVNRAVGKLKAEGLVSAEPYHDIKLTKKGKKLAEWSKNRHSIVLKFLLALGIDEITAHRDAEGIEHHVSQKTLLALEQWGNDKKKIN